MLRTFVIGLALSLPYRGYKKGLHPARTGQFWTVELSLHTRPAFHVLLGL